MATKTHFLDTLTTMTVKATSPDHSVTISLCNAEGLSVSLSTRALQQPEDSLAYQVSATMSELRKAYRRTFIDVVNSARRNPDPHVHEPKPENSAMTPLRRQREKLTSRLDQIRVTGVSTHNQVRVRMANQDDVEVRVRPGSYPSSPNAANYMAEEIRTAMVEAHNELQRAKRKILENSTI